MNAKDEGRRMKDETSGRLLEDMAGLVDCFQVSAGFATAETIRVYAVHHSIATLRNMGLIAPAKLGRWLSDYVPSGKLAEEMEAV